MGTKTPFTIEEMISIPRLSNPAISEDGEQAAWVESATDWDKNEYIPRIFLHNRATGSTSVLAAGEKPSAPAW